MFIKVDEIDGAYKTIVAQRGRIVIFVAPDADALCALKIVTSMLRYVLGCRRSPRGAASACAPKARHFPLAAPSRRLR